MQIDRDTQNRWILGGDLPGVHFRMQQWVNVKSGPHAGKRGMVVSLCSLGSDPVFHVEVSERDDFEAKQSELEAVNH